MTTRKIIHIDMDCFYAAIEARDNPRLRGKPIAVGGDPDRRGVLCTASYEARRYGVRSAMASAHALRLCPDLIILPVDMQKYVSVSRRIQSIFRRYTDRIEPLSLDEAFLDVTHSSLHQGSATYIAQEIRQQIFTQEKLTASAGIAPNKFLAKVASDWNKPNGQFVIPPAGVDEFIKKLPARNIFGVGKVTAAKLESMGIETCEDLQQYSLLELVKLFGSFGEHLYQMARGIDHREVVTDHARKSLSVEETYEHDLGDEHACRAQFPDLYAQFTRRMERLQQKQVPRIKSVFVKIKYSDFSVTTIQAPYHALSPEVFENLFMQRYAERPDPVRLLGIGVHLEEATPWRQVQLEIPFQEMDARTF